MVLSNQFQLFSSCASQTDEPNIFGNTALHMACHTGQDTVATELVNGGSNINQPNYHADTPLHLAAASSSGVLCLELLINNGADVTVQVKTLFLRREFEKNNKRIKMMYYWIVVIGQWIKCTVCRL